jgi:ketosteroid isomerase-like protein
MSQGNVEIVRRAFEAWSALDAEAATSAFDPAVTWHIAEDEPDAHMIEGVQGILRSLRSWGECGRARDAGAALEIEETQVYLVQDGNVVEVRVFRRVEDALEAARLSASS